MLPRCKNKCNTCWYSWEEVSQPQEPQRHLSNRGAQRKFSLKEMRTQVAFQNLLPTNQGRVCSLVEASFPLIFMIYSWVSHLHCTLFLFHYFCNNYKTIICYKTFRFNGAMDENPWKPINDLNAHHDTKRNSQLKEESSYKPKAVVIFYLIHFLF